MKQISRNRQTNRSPIPTPAWQWPQDHGSIYEALQYAHPLAQGCPQHLNSKVVPTKLTIKK